MPTTIKADVSPRQVRLSNGLNIHLLRHGEFLDGLGQIFLDDLPLRTANKPWRLEIRTPCGVQFTKFRIVRQEQTANVFRLHLQPCRLDGGPMEWMLHTVRNRWNTSSCSEAYPAEDTEVTLSMRPVSRQIGSHYGCGLTYRFSYKSESLPIYRLLEHGSWEIGGEAVGNEIWLRGGFAPPITAIENADQFYSSEWYAPAASNPNIFQFLTLQTTLQGFTFTASSHGVLVTLATEVAHIRTLLEKQRNQNCIDHWHEHCGDLTCNMQSSPMEVLFFPGQRNRDELANLHHDVAEYVANLLHRDIGLQRERVTTFGMITDEGTADMDAYTTQALPALTAAGVRTIDIENQFANNANTFGVFNHCCTTNLKVAEAVGADKLRNFCQRARQLGCNIEMWGNTAISTLALMASNYRGLPGRIQRVDEPDSTVAVLRSAADPFVRNLTGSYESDHYAPMFAVMNLRDTTVCQHWLTRWGELNRDTGINGIFWDSSNNLSSDKFHYVANTQPGAPTLPEDRHAMGSYRPTTELMSAIYSQYSAHLKLVGQMQQIGYHYCTEDLGVFGTHRTGPSVAVRADNLFLWQDCLADFDAPALRLAGHDPQDIFFRALAYRMMWMLFWDANYKQLSFGYQSNDPQRSPTPWHLQMLAIFNQVSHAMIDRHILPGEQGVVYRNGKQLVLWAFAPMKWDSSWGTIATDLSTNTTADMTDRQIMPGSVFITPETP